MNIEKKDIMNVLKTFVDASYSKNIVDMQMINNVHLDGVKLKLDLNSPITDETHRIDLTKRLKQFLEMRGLIVEDITFSENIPHGDPFSKNPFEDQKKLSGIKHIIAVASGKGGVGKSTVAVNLAAMLKFLNYKVGLLDADIYGPSVNMMMGSLEAKPTTPDGKKINPIDCFGIKTISMGNLMDPETAVIWRGPMLMKAVTQFLTDVVWGELDFLIIDMPPGTGDVQLSITQQVPLSGAIIVTTPQDIALMDVKRGIRMFEKVKVPVLGVVENMSFYTCTNCGHIEHIFGKEKVEKMVRELKSTIIARLPLDADFVLAGDSGEPFVLTYPSSAHAKQFKQIVDFVKPILAF